MEGEPCKGQPHLNGSVTLAIATEWQYPGHVAMKVFATHIWVQWDLTIEDAIRTQLAVLYRAVP